MRFPNMCNECADEGSVLGSVFDGNHTFSDHWKTSIPESLHDLLFAANNYSSSSCQDIVDDGTFEAPIALVFRGSTAPDALILLFKNLMPAKSDLSIVSLESYESVDAWLLPTCLSLLPRLERIILRDPVLSSLGHNPEQFWSLVCSNLKAKNQLCFLSVKWTSPFQNPTTFVRDDTWLEMLMSLPLEEYYHEGESDISCQRWTRGQVLRLLYHKTLKAVHLYYPLEAGAWPSRAEQALWRLPKRSTPLRLALPAVSQEERIVIMPGLPVRISLSLVVLLR